MQRKALQRLLDECHGNPIVRKTLTCLERELEGAQAIVVERGSSDDCASESDSDVDAAPTVGRRRMAGTQSEPLSRQRSVFTGATTSMLPPADAAPRR